MFFYLSLSEVFFPLGIVIALDRRTQNRSRNGKKNTREEDIDKENKRIRMSRTNLSVACRINVNLITVRRCFAGCNGWAMSITGFSRGSVLVGGGARELV